MTWHQAAYTVSGIKPQMRARPDIRPAIRNVGIKPKLRAFTDIDALNHYTFTPRTRAHPDIGQTSISNFNGLASAAEAGACKKCRVTGKYYEKEARSFTGTTPTAPACCCMSSEESAPTTVTAVIIIGSSTAGLRPEERERDGQRHHHRAGRPPASRRTSDVTSIDTSKPDAGTDPETMSIEEIRCELAAYRPSTRPEVVVIEEWMARRMQLWRRLDRPDRWPASTRGTDGDCSTNC